MLEDRLMFDNAGKKKLKVGDLFAGVGGFSLGFMREGCELCWAVEWDKTCQKVLRRQHPHTKIFGDITKVAAEDLDDVDIIIGGSPCQDLSVAGKRKGLEGERSGLFHEFIRLVRAKSPRWVVWENVPGALSSNGGKDFGVVLGEMADSGYPDIAYRVLDARYFGVAQRRSESLSLPRVKLAEVLQSPAQPGCSDYLSQYKLSKKACEGILRRAKRRGKLLPPLLKEALNQQVSRTEASPQSTSEGKKASSASKKSKQSQKPSAKAAKSKRSASQSSLPKKARGNGGTQETNPQA